MEGKRENQNGTGMAEASSIRHPYKLSTPNLNSHPKAQKATPRVFSSILYKPIFFVVLVALLPMFPSRAPEFTKVWEILHLLFVGIAVSYGIFGRRNAEPDTEKEVLQKDESLRSFISQMLQGSPVFDEEDDGIGSTDESKGQTWSYQCYRNEPPCLVASKLLLLPIRSIKQQNQEINGQFTSANCGVKSHYFYSKNESAVLPSPIPWISRSGSMGNKVERVAGKKDSSSSSSTVPSTPASTTLPSPRWLFPSPLFPSDTTKPKSMYKNKATPPPPPPPRFLKHGHGYHRTARSFKEELKGFSRLECWDTPSGTVRTSNEQAEYRGEEVKVAVAVAGASGGGKEDASNCEAGAGGEENEVDKKADEFIARFREQIRLQRIESIKRSTIENPSDEKQ